LLKYQILILRLKRKIEVKDFLKATCGYTAAMSAARRILKQTKKQPKTKTLVVYTFKLVRASPSLLSKVTMYAMALTGKVSYKLCL